MNNNTRFGCLTPMGIIGALIMIVFIIGVSVAEGGALFSPGELNAQQSGTLRGGVASHADLKGDCAACHTAIWEKAHMIDRCLTCHSEVDLSEKTFHGVMKAQGKLSGCIGCHTDHNGPTSALTVYDTTNFPHEILRFSLAKHQKQTNGADFLCSDCHGDAISKMDLDRCLVCHENIDQQFTESHVMEFGYDCLVCHDGVDRFGKSFDHQLTSYPLLGKHQTVSCVTCHQGVSTPADFANAPQSCYDCHISADIHNGSFGQNCATCHAPTGWLPAQFDHTKTRFALLGEHQEAECEECHVNNQYTGTPLDCYSCHKADDKHNGEYGQDCSSCHTPNNWEPFAVDHARFNFELTGSHANVKCTDCHTNNQYKGTPTTCFGCHSTDDEHGGFYGQDCSACHSTNAWEPATFDHSISAFPLTGKHQSVECANCHTNNTFKGTPTVCVECHADPAYHQGLFANQCETCHTTSAWSPAAYNQPHQFPLNHEDVKSCRDCHTDSLQTYTCYTCHNKNEMISEHSEEGVRNIDNCTECHADGREGDD